MTTESLLSDIVRRVFGSVSPTSAVEAAELRGKAPEVWAAIADAGFPWIGVPEELGGSGGTTSDAVTVLIEAGRVAAPVPLAETMVASWILAAAGLTIPEGPLALVTDASGLITDGQTIIGKAERIGWARSATSIVTALPARSSHVIGIVSPSDVASIEAHTNLASEPRDTLSFEGCRYRATAALPVDVKDRVRQWVSLARSALIAGAINRAADLTIEYTGARRQFGRPIASFQAVQVHLVDLVGAAAQASIAVASAARSIDASVESFEVAAAASIAADAATVAIRASHQAHGAMGMAREYPLHHATRRLMSWQLEGTGYPGEAAAMVGSVAMRAGAAGLYPLLSGGRDAIGPDSDCPGPVSPPPENHGLTTAENS